MNSFDPRSKKSVDEKINIGNVKMNAGLPSYPILFYLAGRIPSPPTTPPPFKKKLPKVNLSLPEACLEKSFEKTVDKKTATKYQITEQWEPKFLSGKLLFSIC